MTSKRVSKGTPEQLMSLVKDRISELSQSDELMSATDISASSKHDGVLEVLRFFKNRLNWDIADPEVQNYATAVAEYMDMSRNAYSDIGQESPYTLEDWYRDTKLNYPEELEAFEPVESADDIACGFDESYSRERFLHSLIGDVDSDLRANELEMVNAETFDDSLEVTVKHPNGAVTEFTIPFADLSMSFDRIYQDADMIVDEILNEFRYMR